jgi:hypothetical protein
MNEQKQSAFREVLSEGYSKIFFQNWPTWVGGLLIGIMSIITFAWARPWGVAGGLRNWGDNLFHFLGIYGTAPIHPLFSTSSLLTLGLLFGAVASSLMSKEFAVRKAPPLELAKGVVGGILMGVGSAMAGGCNVGGFFSALSAMSMSGVAMMVGLLIGAYLGLKYLYWELENLPSGGGGAAGPQKESSGTLKAMAPYLGALVFLGVLIAAWVYNAYAYTVMGGLLLCGAAFGVIIQRTRFCFVRCFREPFMTGEATQARAVAGAVIISLLGFAAIKWAGLRGELVYVPQAFFVGGLVGGLIFGVGMVIAGGCGSGSVWRCGEGQNKLLLAVVFFCLSISLFEKLIVSSKTLQTVIGTGVYLPDWINYKWSLLALILLMVAYFLIASWNEKTEKFVVEL